MIIEGGKFKDDRGEIRFVNDFDMTEVKRFYTIFHPDTSIIRAWQGHKIETRWFYCTEGIFDIRAVKIDNWGNPSDILKTPPYSAISCPIITNSGYFSKLCLSPSEMASTYLFLETLDVEGAMTTCSKGAYISAISS